MTITDSRAGSTAPTREDGPVNTPVRHDLSNERSPRGYVHPGQKTLTGRVAGAFRARAEYVCEKYLPIPDSRPAGAEVAKEAREDPTTARAAVLYLERAFGGSAGLFYLGLTLLTCWVVLNVLAPGVAVAQPTGGGDGGAIQGAIDNARNWLSTIMVSLGGLGMIASIAVKAVARTNENMHHAAHMGMTGSGIALIAGLLINDIISLLQSFAGG